MLFLFAEIWLRQSFEDCCSLFVFSNQSLASAYTADKALPMFAFYTKSGMKNYNLGGIKK